MHQHGPEHNTPTHPHAHTPTRPHAHTPTRPHAHTPTRPRAHTPAHALTPLHTPLHVVSGLRRHPHPVCGFFWLLVVCAPPRLLKGNACMTHAPPPPWSLAPCAACNREAALHPRDDGGRRPPTAARNTRTHTARWPGTTPRERDECKSEKKLYRTRASTTTGTIHTHHPMPPAGGGEGGGDSAALEHEWGFTAWRRAWRRPGFRRARRRTPLPCAPAPWRTGRR